MDDKDQQVTEVRQTNQQVGDTKVVKESVTTNRAVPTNILAQRVIYYVGGALILLLVFRFVLALLGAAEGNGFVDFIYGLSSMFVTPFFGIFGEPTLGASQLETSTLVAIIVYALVIVGVAKLFAINSQHDEV